MTRAQRFAPLLVAAALCAVPVAPALAQETTAEERDPSVARLRYDGADGGNLYYHFYCVNGARGSVVVETDGSICSLRLGGEQVCRRDWTHQGAAAYWCR